MLFQTLGSVPSQKRFAAIGAFGAAFVPCAIAVLLQTLLRGSVNTIVKLLSADLALYALDHEKGTGREPKRIEEKESVGEIFFKKASKENSWNRERVVPACETSSGQVGGPEKHITKLYENYCLNWIFLIGPSFVPANNHLIDITRCSKFSFAAVCVSHQVHRGR